MSSTATGINMTAGGEPTATHKGKGGAVVGGGGGSGGGGGAAPETPASIGSVGPGSPASTTAVAISAAGGPGWKDAAGKATSTSVTVGSTDICKSNKKNDDLYNAKPRTGGWAFFRSMAFLSLVTLVFQNSSLVLLTRYSRSQIPPEKSYFTSTLVLNQEILKMVMCLVIFARERRCHSVGEYWQQLKAVVWHRETLKLIVPAALFTFQNFSLFVALTHLDAMMFQVISQTKLLSAAVFSVLLLDRHLTKIQWFTLALLTVGILFSQDSTGSGSRGGGKHASSKQRHNALIGIFSCIASGLSSSFAGVYFEKVVKTTAPSLAIRNIHLSIFGIPFALVSMLVLDVWGSKGKFHYWRGYDQGLTWLLVFIHALGGLLVAVVVKYADNILKGFATGIATILSGVFAALFWSFVPSLRFMFGSILVIVSSVLYQYAEAPKGSR